MQVQIHKSAGLRNDLTISFARCELDTVYLSVANRDLLMALPGLTRHREPTRQEREENRKCKITLEEHLKQLRLVDDSGTPLRPAIAIGNRNLGNNHGFVAWQHDQSPKFFHIQGDPLNYTVYSCVVAEYSGRLSIQNLRFDSTGQRVHRADDGADLTNNVEWATFGQQVLRGGNLVPIDEIIDQFYDIRHVLGFDTNWPEGKQIEADIFRGYPMGFREQALRALRALGVPRNRYLLNCIGLSSESVSILQREGTFEEAGTWLRDAGAEDGIILDAGGSVACWAWWLYPNGGFIFAAPDYRPSASSIIAFVLRVPVQTNLPGGSVSYTVV